MDQIKTLHEEGLGLKTIARRLQMARVTVRKYLLLYEPPPRGGCAIRVNIALFDQYLRQRINEDPTIERMQLFKEIKARGYNGGRTMVFEHLHKYVYERMEPKQSKPTCIFFFPQKSGCYCLKS